ncbi:hypothetical protein ACE7GA_26320 [Roseomonas sp. CCTCC AB2023176]|uniref:hypothetical protein n=1 Tax=Roseomonas sp. CCTCC AB2023176 TaxID=3342640 RepID=UPI0035E0564B
MSSEKQVEYLKHWFTTFYEMYAQNGSQVSTAGIPGPFLAFDELEYEFLDVATHDAIEEAAEQVDLAVDPGQVVYWVPSQKHPYHSSNLVKSEFSNEKRTRRSRAERIERLATDLSTGPLVGLGTQAEQALRAEVTGALNKLDELLDRLPRHHGRMGHNNPPPDEITEVGKAAEQLREASRLMRQELTKETPNAVEVAQATKRINNTVVWIGKKGDSAADGFAKEIGKRAAQGVVIVGAYMIPAHFTDMMGAARMAVESALRWLSYFSSLL